MCPIRENIVVKRVLILTPAPSSSVEGFASYVHGKVEWQPPSTGSGTLAPSAATVSDVVQMGKTVSIVKWQVDTPEAAAPLSQASLDSLSSTARRIAMHVVSVSLTRCYRLAAKYSAGNAEGIYFIFCEAATTIAAVDCII